MSFSSVINLPTSLSSDNTWISWYKDLRKTLGSTKANDLFYKNWESQNASDSDANTTLLRSTLEKYGLEIRGGILGESLDFGKQIVGYIDDVFTAGKWVTIVVGGVLLVSVGGLLIQIVFRPSVRKEAVNIGTTIASRGIIKPK